LKKSLRNALWAGTAVAVVAVAAAAVPVVSASAAVACAPAWSSSTIYVKDNVVSYQAKNYTAQWWTQNEVPTASGEWGVWRNAVACGGTPTTPPPPPPPRPPPPASPHDADDAPGHQPHHAPHDQPPGR
jgi:chitinase